MCIPSWPHFAHLLMQVFQHDNAPCHKAKSPQAGFMNMAHDILLSSAFLITGPENLNLIEQLWDVEGKCPRKICTDPCRKELGGCFQGLPVCVIQTKYLLHWSVRDFLRMRTWINAWVARYHKPPLKKNKKKTMKLSRTARDYQYWRQTTRQKTGWKLIGYIKRFISRTRLLAHLEDNKTSYAVSSGKSAPVLIPA